MIDNLVGLCRTGVPGFQAYIHTDLSDRFVDWLNDNKSEIGKDDNDMGWEITPLDAGARLDVKESDNLYPLINGRNKIGYAKGSEHQAFYQNLLNQTFPLHSLRWWRV